MHTHAAHTTTGLTLTPSLPLSHMHAKRYKFSASVVVVVVCAIRCRCDVEGKGDDDDGDGDGVVALCCVVMSAQQQLRRRRQQHQREEREVEEGVRAFFVKRKRFAEANLRPTVRSSLYCSHSLSLSFALGSRDTALSRNVVGGCGAKTDNLILLFF